MKRLYLDIETCPNIGYFWSAGYKVDITYKQIKEERRIITAAFNWEGKRKIHDLTWDKERQDNKLVEDLVNVMDEADEVVAHYGDGFDLPWVRTRAMYHNIVTPVWKSVDTCAWARRFFILNSNKLDYLAQFLGVGTKIRTEYDLWVHATGGSDKVSKDAVEKMRRYNRWDTHLLNPVYDRLSLYCPLASHAGVLEGKERYSCPRCGSEDNIRYVKPTVSRAGTIKHELYCKVCPKYFVVSNTAFQVFEAEKGAVKRKGKNDK